MRRILKEEIHFAVLSFMLDFCVGDAIILKSFALELCNVIFFVYKL
jgi:hypothetical protein